MLNEQERKLWQQAEQELSDFCIVLDRKNQPITASQIRMAIRIANLYVALPTKADESGAVVG